MIVFLKKFLYFPVAYYFRFFARFRLSRWNPRIIVVTGSNGKTILFNLLKSQIKDRAKYSEHANSSFGIPFDILDLHREKLLVYEWLSLFLLAPIRAFKTPPKKEFYVVETDCDRPREGKFLASLLNPEIVLWLNTARTHGMNFDFLVTEKKYPHIEDAIAYEFGFFLEYCKKFAVVNDDQALINKQIKRTTSEICSVKKDNFLQEYKITQNNTLFCIDGEEYSFSALLPEEVFYSIVYCRKTMDYLGLSFDRSFKAFKLPPGRSSIFRGIKDITIVDSSYNANLASMSAILNMFEKIPVKAKWVVLGDMLEQGENEREEHEKLAQMISAKKFERVLLMGPRVAKYTYPVLANEKIIIEKFITPKEVLNYLLKNIHGGETILFKGARFLEGVIEHLLEDKEDEKNLCRREKVWNIRRKQWGL